MKFDWLKDVEAYLDLSKSTGYVFNKNVFRVVVVLLIVLAGVSMVVDGLGGVYYTCSSAGIFEVAKTGDVVFCNHAGEVVGSKPSFLTDNFGGISFLLVLFGFLYNHLFFNGGRKDEGF